MPIRVCVLTPAVPPVIGGAERSISLFVRGLVESGCRVAVVTANAPDDDFARLVASSGGSVTVLPGTASGPMSWEARLFGPSAVLVEALDGARADIVHAFSHATALSAAMALPDGAPPLVASFHEMSSDQTVAGRRKSRFVYNLKRLTTIVTLSDYFHQIALRYLDDPARARQCRQGLDLRLLASGSQEAGRGYLGLDRRSRPVLLCPGRWVPAKGQLDLLAAVRKLKASGLPYPALAYVGSMTSAPHVDSRAYRASLASEVESAGLAGDVVMLDEIHPTLMSHLYAAADLVVQPSYREGLGFVGVEAMAAGRPFVGTRIAGFLQYCRDGENCLLVDVADAGGMAAAIARLLAEPSLRQRLTAAGLRTARDFDYMLGVRDVLDVYREVLDQVAGNHAPEEARDMT